MNSTKDLIMPKTQQAISIDNQLSNLSFELSELECYDEALGHLLKVRKLMMDELE